MLFGEKMDWPWPNFSETRERHQEPPEDITSVGRFFTIVKNLQCGVLKNKLEPLWFRFQFHTSIVTANPVLDPIVQNKL
jgi:hypothetical protein